MACLFSDPDLGLHTVFKERYLGNTATLFIDTMNEERREYFEETRLPLHFLVDQLSHTRSCSTTSQGSVDVVEDLGPWTPPYMSKTDMMVKFGRPLWYNQYIIDPSTNIFKFAMDKLSAGHEEDSPLAALGVRVGITLDVTDSYEVESRLVESHLRVLSDARDKRELADSEWERKGLVSRLLVTSAYDIALEKRDGTMKPENIEAYYHRAIATMGKNISFTLCVKSLDEAFSNCYVFFSHFAIAGDSEMLSAFGLSTALLRGIALQVKDRKEYIDAIIPVHMAS
ncbi:hypothetical protein RSAG8_07391, partial [Rhizoctonia solani AG-8 WAC10335]